MLDIFRLVQDEKPWRNMIGEIVHICFELSDIVSEIVNNSSPEGHFPMDLNIPSNNYCLSNSQATLVTSQMVLLCSWRTIKETSLLFGYLTSKCPMYSENESSAGLISEDQVSIRYIYVFNYLLFISFLYYFPL